MKQEKDIAKLSPPRLPAVFNRTRLFARLDACRLQPVTWISGLPGSGKTTLAASYIEAKQIPAIWYQMDRSDNDPANFFYYMTAAARKAAGCGIMALPGLAPEHFMNLARYSVQYFRGLYGILNKPFVIVLDNYHEVSADSRLHWLINDGMDQVPPGLNILVLSRTAPPPVMSRLLMHRKIVEIQGEDLSLTGEECRGIAALHDKWRAGLEHLPMLLEYTGGWTAGLVIMLEYGDPGAERNLRGEVAKEFFFNYFAGEIFHKMAPDIQNFLLRTAYLPSFTPEAAERLTGFAGAGPVLAEMNRKNYFTEKKVEDGVSYQFHPLFREFLLAKAERGSAPGALTDLYRKAADILVEHGQLEDAFQLYAKADHHAAQADLIRGHARSLIAQRRLQIVEQWLQALPGKMLAADPWLLFWYGQCRLPFNPGESRNLFLRAHEHFRKQGNTTGLLLAVTGTIETILTEWGDFRQLDPWIAELDVLLTDRAIPPDREIEARAVVAMFAALMFRQPHHPGMRLWEDRTLALLRSDADNGLRLVAGSYLSHYYYWLGDIFQAEVVMEIMDQLLAAADLSPLALMTVQMQKAVHGWFTADFNGCQEAVQQGLEEAEQSGVHLLDNWLLAQGVYATLSLDDHEGAKTFLDRMKSILDSQRHLDISHYYYLRSIYHLQKGDVELARRYIEDSLQRAREVGTLFPEGLNAVTAAQIYFEIGDTRTAEQLTMRAREIGDDMRSHLLRMLSFINEAYFSLKLGRGERAREALRNALNLQRTKGIVNFSGWRNPVMTELYAEALKSEIETDFVKESIRRRNVPPAISSTVIAGWPWRVKIFTLGRFATVIDGKPLRGKGKQQRKPQELLQALIALGGREVSLSRLEALLWPDADGDKARQALATTLHRLRRLLHHEKALVLSGTKLSLNDRYCWVDVWAMDTLADTIHDAVAAGNFAGEEAAFLAEKVLVVYQGDFLNNEDEGSWVIPARARFRNRFLQTVTTLAREWEGRGAFAEAEDLYRRALEADECAEELHQGLLRSYLAQGRTAEGLAAYERLREILASTRQIVPSPETESIHFALHQESQRSTS